MSLPSSLFFLPLAPRPAKSQRALKYGEERERERERERETSLTFSSSSSSFPSFLSAFSPLAEKGRGKRDRELKKLYLEIREKMLHGSQFLLIYFCVGSRSST